MSTKALIHLILVPHYMHRKTVSVVELYQRRCVVIRLELISLLHISSRCVLCFGFKVVHKGAFGKISFPPLRGKTGEYLIHKVTFVCVLNFRYFSSVQWMTIFRHQTISFVAFHSSGSMLDGKINGISIESLSNLSHNVRQLSITVINVWFYYRYAIEIEKTETLWDDQEK